MGSEALTSYMLSSPPLRVFYSIEFGYRWDVSFELPGQDCGELLGGCVDVVHDGRRGVRIGVVGNDVPRRHPLEIHDIVRRGHDEGSQDTEAEGASCVLGDMAT